MILFGVCFSVVSVLLVTALGVTKVCTRVRSRIIGRQEKRHFFIVGEI